MCYRYYPGGERAASLVDTDITSPILPDELDLFYYDASWRLLEIRSDKTSRSDWTFPDSSASFTLSNTRQFIWGEQYIDELVAYMSDTAASINSNGTLSANPTFATLQYALTDRNFSVIGLGFEADEVGDRIRYAPYGTFTAYPAGDANADGAVNSADTTAILIASGYKADLDVNMDGSVDSLDSSMVSGLTGRTLSSGQLSDNGNIVGWCGYLYEESTGVWLARHRWQIPELGRWANRDPIGYAGGGQNLYEYVNGNPVMLLDSFGLKPNQVWERIRPLRPGERGYRDPGLALTSINLYEIAQEKRCYTAPDRKYYDVIILDEKGKYYRTRRTFFGGEARNEIVGIMVFDANDNEQLFHVTEITRQKYLGDRIDEIQNGLKEGMLLAVPGGELSCTLAEAIGDPSLTNTASVGLTIFGGYIASRVAGKLFGRAIHEGPRAPLGRGSTGRTAPHNIKEQMAMKQAMADPEAGEVLRNIKLGDDRWKADDG